MLAGSNEKSAEKLYLRLRSIKLKINKRENQTRRHNPHCSEQNEQNEMKSMYKVAYIIRIIHILVHRQQYSEKWFGV